MHPRPVDNPLVHAFRGWRSIHHLTGDEFKARLEQLKAQGFRLTDLSGCWDGRSELLPERDDERVLPAPRRCSGQAGRAPLVRSVLIGGSAGRGVRRARRRPRAGVRSAKRSAPRRRRACGGVRLGDPLGSGFLVWAPAHGGAGYVKPAPSGAGWGCSGVFGAALVAAPHSAPGFDAPLPTRLRVCVWAPASAPSAGRWL